MFRWFRRAPALPGAALAMIGAKPSDHVLFLGAKDPSLAADVGTVTLLNGRTVVVDVGSDAANRTEQAAVKAGAILEFVDAPFNSLPFEPATFHIVVAAAAAAWWTEYAAALGEGVRVLRPGGRIILLAGEPARGILRGPTAHRPAPAADAVLAMLTASGFTAARRLAESEGVTYYEGRKAR